MSKQNKIEHRLAAYKIYSWKKFMVYEKSQTFKKKKIKKTKTKPQNSKNNTCSIPEGRRMWTMAKWI